jgi:hypothetical protein
MKGIQVTSTARYYYTPVRMPHMEKQNKEKTPVLSNWDSHTLLVGSKNETATLIKGLTAFL